MQIAADHTHAFVELSAIDQRFLEGHGRHAHNKVFNERIMLVIFDDIGVMIDIVLHTQHDMFQNHRFGQHS